MTKFFIVLFSVLTLGAGYLTYNDIGLQDTNFSDSVRSGSGGTLGYRHGK
ncbi:MAG: hypothetical protein U9R50_10185 [Campylobacterota bacterium]|nr:hypothetical protein [Campylobacterota bacterium]